MDLFNKLKQIFKTKPKGKFPVNFTKVFNTFEEFIDYVNTTDIFDNHYVYFYTGNSKVLANIINGDDYYGEMIIPNSSLRYIGDCKIIKSHLVFTDTLFFPDQVFEIKNKYSLFKQPICFTPIYKSNNNGTHTIKSVVIACDNVYLCNK